MTEHSPKVWEATLEDVEEGSAVGPFFDEAEVSQFVGDDHWIPTQRFEVVRGQCDVEWDQHVDGRHGEARAPVHDFNVAAIKWLRSRLP